MRFGFHFLDFTLPTRETGTGSGTLAGHLTRTANAADVAGASWLTVMDHFFQMEQFQTAHDPMLEGYTTLGLLAAKTEHVKLGTVVTGVTYRHPGLLVKQVNTLDVLSEGRAFFGIGAAWYEREHLALGVPYPPMSERFERLEEALQIALQMWSDDEGPYNGVHYQLAETINVPQPIQRPHPPIVIGGGGEKKTLRLVAKYADACNLNVTDVDEVAHKLQVLREHCDTEGRDYSTIEKTMQGGAANPVADPDAFLRYAEQLAALEIEHIQLRTQTDDPAAYVSRFGETVAPRLAEIVPAVTRP